MPNGMEKKQKNYFKNFHFIIHSSKSQIKGLKNIDLLHELPFYDQLSIYEMTKAFKWYAKTHNVELVNSKDPLAELEALKPSIKDLFTDVLD